MDKPTLPRIKDTLGNRDYSNNDNTTANQPYRLKQGDIAELADIETIRDSWGAQTVAEMIELFEDSIYGVKFDFVSGSPGYVGPLYVLHGDTLEPPFRLIRREGRLVVID